MQSSHLGAWSMSSAVWNSEESPQGQLLGEFTIDYSFYSVNYICTLV